MTLKESQVQVLYGPLIDVETTTLESSANRQFPIADQ